MTTATLPAGVFFDNGTNAYWVRADYFVCRGRRGWELTDCIDGQRDAVYYSQRAALAALAALA